MNARGRIATAGVFLALPFFFLVGLAVWFWISEVPKISVRERKRATREYRESALELAAGSNAVEVVRARNWRQTGRIAGVPWGYLAEDGRIRVWYGAGATVRSGLVDSGETDVVLTIGIACVAGLALALMLTVLGFSFFIRLERDRTDFVAAAAHDLETPVAALGMVLENRAAGVETDAEAFAECGRIATRLGRLVDNLRDFVHRGRRGTPVPSDFDIVGALREAYRPFAEDYRDLLGGDVRISGEDVRVRADETLVQQILWNLFANDLKYAAPYGCVRVSVASADGRVRADFVDEGRGLAPREMKRIFERYYRARSTMESGRGGFGIGLCSAREFARAMDGDLTVRANEPHGCIFTLTLPAAADGRSGETR